MEKFVISNENAVKELISVYSSHNSPKKITEEDVIEKYENALDAIKRGNLVFENNIPTLKLTEPVKDEEGDIICDSITFKTRIKPKAMASLAKGIDFKKDSFSYVLRSQSFLSGQSEGVIDSLSKYDYDVVSQVCNIFL